MPTLLSPMAWHQITDHQLMTQMNPLQQYFQLSGPQIFDVSGDLSLWLTIIGTSSPQSVNHLIKLIDNKSPTEKYDLALHILKNGWDQVIGAEASLRLDEDHVIHIDDGHQIVSNQSDVVTTDDEVDRMSEQTIDSSDAKDIKSIDNQEEKQSHDLEEDQEMDSNESDSYVEASAKPLTPLSQDSYKSCYPSPQKTLTSLKDMNEVKQFAISLVSDVCQSMSVSTPTAVSKLTEERFRDPVLSLSPIASVYSQSRHISPTNSLNTSSISSHSSQSMLSSSKSPSKRSAIKTTEKIIEEYNSLIPYESYCSEEQFFDKSKQKIISDSLYEKISEENTKNLCLNTNDSERLRYSANR